MLDNTSSSSTFLYFHDLPDPTALHRRRRNGADPSAPAPGSPPAVAPVPDPPDLPGD